MHSLNYRKNILIVFVGLLSLIQIFFTDITYDESYYWIYSKFLDFGYYDHPPMVAVFIWFGELLGHGVIYTRLTFIISMLFTLFTMTKLVARENVIFLIVSFFCFPLLVASGFLALPDTPLLLFSVLLWKKSEDYLKENSVQNILSVSIIIACLFYSKYHGILVVIFTLIGIPQIAKRKSFYIITLLVVLFYLPHVIWQFNNDFVSFKFHLTGRKEKHFDIENITNYLLGLIFVCGFLAAPLFTKMALINSKIKSNKIYFYNSFAFFVFVFLLSFRNAIELNWIVTACASFIILALREPIVKKSSFYILLLPSFLVLVMFRVLLIYDFGLREKVDRLNEIHGWQARFNEFYALDLEPHVVFDNYQYAAKFSYFRNYIYPVKHLRSRESHYSILNLIDKYKINLDDEVSFVGTKNIFDSYRIETNYKDPIYIEIKTQLRDIMDKYE